LLGHLDGTPVISGVVDALAVPQSQVRIFGKPECKGHRRLAVAVATGATPEEARSRALRMAGCIKIEKSQK
jgi:phosphoribosylglycinamide formyltransferase 2